MRFSDNIITQAFHRQKKRCAMCGYKLDATYQAHHIKRVADGGTATLSNCVILCRDCHTYGAHGGNFRNPVSLHRSEFKYIDG